ncbi:MAG: peptidoglycan DD-metalloendopeptidase family protein [Burkholderiaceae bacterium]
MKHPLIHFTLMLAVAALLHGCAEMQANAPIDDRTATRDKSKSPPPKPASSASTAAAEPTDPAGFYTVRKGDTLGKIAKQFSQSVRDLSEWNRLSDPNDIRVGQQLRVVPPEDNKVASVPTDTGMEMRALDTATNGNSSTGANAASANPVRGSGGVKNGPLGRKVAYSDQAWSDMQRGEPAKSLTDNRKPLDSPPPAAGRFMWPTEGKVIRSFDASRKGIDIAGQPGQPIVSVGEGTVLYANNMRGFGNLVIIDHRDGLVSAYGHNKSILVKEGQAVTKGQRIADMGDTDAESVRLHFEIRQLGKAVDPMGFLPSR